MRFTDPTGFKPEESGGHIAKGAGRFTTQKQLRDDHNYSKVRAENACLALALISAAEDFVEKRLGLEQVATLLDTLYKDIVINDLDNVQSKEKVLQYALAALEEPDVNFTLTKKKTDSSDYSLLHGTSVNDNKHWQLGTKNAKLLTDPWDTVDNNKPGTVSAEFYIDFEEK